MDGVKFEFNDIISFLRKMILSEGGNWAYDILLSIFNNIIVNKVIY